MRFLSLLGIVSLIAAFTAVLVFAEHVVDNSKNTSYLFVMSGTSGSLDGDNLTLNGVPSVVYFSDRPARIAGHISLVQFIESWDKGNLNSKKGPPNSTLSVLNKDGVQNIVLEILSIELKDGSVILRVKILDGGHLGEFQESSLFIDNSNAIGVGLGGGIAF